jgi:hypothetical protein
MKRNRICYANFLLTVLVAGCFGDIAEDEATDVTDQGNSVSTWSSEGHSYAAAEESRESRVVEPETSQQRAERIEREEQYERILNTFDRRVGTINTEIESLGTHPWAGVYYQGDGLGTNEYVHISPRAGIAYSDQGCVGRAVLHYGTVSYKNGLIQIDWQVDEEPLSEHPVQEYLTIRWGTRAYLVPPEEIFQFCGAIATMHEPRDDEGRVVTSFPAEKQPPDSIKNRVHYTQVVTIDIGAADGVLPGMGFEPKNRDEARLIARVQSVRDNESELLLDHYVFDDDPFHPATDSWVFINEDFFRR